MKKIFLSLLGSVLLQAASAQSSLVLALIPGELKNNAHSIIRNEEITLDIKSEDKASYKVHRMITVLNESGKNELSFTEQADKFHSLEDVTITLYNAMGEKVKKYSKKDLHSLSNIGEGLVSDGKYYFLTIPVSSYPVHVEYEYEIKFNGILSLPYYQVQSPRQSVQTSSYTVIVPAAVDIRYKERNVKLAPVMSTDKDKKIYNWSTKNMPALLYEPGSVSAESRYPRIVIAPNKFSLDGYEGDMSSWEKFGEWYGSLSKKANNLPAERKLFFQNLVKGAANDREKAAIIYKYLQDNCRYVLITLGIGGFKPFEASFVDSKKYGDCKALSNYTQACLDAVGIKSHQALINASYDKEPVDPSFSYNSFNHVILCIPMQKDSIWLECTSNTNEFGVLGSFTENRNALLITENGGRLVPTPRSEAKHNRFSTYCTVNLNEDGSGIAKVDMQTTGEYRQHAIAKEKKDDLKKYLVNYLGFIQPDDFNFTENKDASSRYTIDLAFEKIPAFSAGSKMFLNPRVHKIWSASLPDMNVRTLDYYFEHPFIKEDTTIYKLPAGYNMEVLPETKKLDFAYGNFNSAYSYDKDKNELRTIARLELKNHLIPAAGYEKAKTFFDAVLAEYNSKIVIKKLN